VGKGTGLGLSQIHGFAAQSGGRAEIDSVAGEGTTIRLLLPRTEAELAKPRRAAPAAAAGGGRTVLLVEDNDQVREFAEHLLTDLGYRVLPAESAEAALPLLGEAIDLVFSDVVMPGKSGIELARAVRERFPQMPVLLATGYSDEVVGGQASQFEVIRKPFGAETLATALAHAFQNVEPDR
jgi:CheY-like chemotaxis protein